MLDELKIRYKESKLPVRLGLCALLALTPATLLYFDESAAVEEEYANVESQEKAAAQKLVQAESTLKNLPKAESELAFTRDQLKKAEGRLPDTIAVDEILRSIGKSSKTFGVNVVLFEPQAEVVRGDNYKYSELPFKISIEGNDYSQICEWLDEVAGSKSKMYLKAWKVVRKSGLKRNNEAFGSGLDAIKGQNLTPSEVAEQEGRKAREGMRLILETDMSIYKMASAAQVAAARDSLDPKRADPANSKPAPNGQTPPKQPGDGSNPPPVHSNEGAM